MSEAVVKAARHYDASRRTRVAVRLGVLAVVCVLAFTSVTGAFALIPGEGATYSSRVVSPP